MMVASMVLLLMEVSLIFTVANFRAVGAGPLAPIGVNDGLGGRGAVLGVVHLSAQAVDAHAPLGRHLVGAHLEGDGGVVQRLQRHFLVKDVPAGPWSCHARLEESETE